MSPPGTPARPSSVMLTPVLLAADKLGLPVVKVHEVIPPAAVADVAKTSAFAGGAIQLRGETIPVLDLRAHVDRPAADPKVFLVIADVAPRAQPRRRLGLLVHNPESPRGLTPDEVARLNRSGARYVGPAAP